MLTFVWNYFLNLHLTFELPISNSASLHDAVPIVQIKKQHITNLRAGTLVKCFIANYEVLTKQSFFF